MDDRIDRLSVLIGTWDTTITMLNEDGSTGDISSAVDTYRWSDNRKFVLHDVDAQKNGNRTQAMEILAVEPQGEGYNARAYEADGSFADYHADLVATAWRITGEALRLNGTFGNDWKTLSGQWDQLRDGAWQAMMRVRLVRRG